MMLSYPHESIDIVYTQKMSLSYNLHSQLKPIDYLFFLVLFVSVFPSTQYYTSFIAMFSVVQQGLFFFADFLLVLTSFKLV